MNNIQNSPGRIPAEQLRIRSKSYHPSGIFEEFKREYIEQSIIERFEEQVKRYPHRLAIKNEKYEITYSELNEYSNRIAHTIIEQRGEKKEPILLLIEHGISIFAAMFGVLKAGKFYIPIDPSRPKARIVEILLDSQAKLLVTNNKNSALACMSVQPSVALLNIDEMDRNIVSKNPGIRITSQALACITYTSGSTGKQKGVIQNHRSLLHLTMNRTNDFHICIEDRIALLDSIDFAASFLSIFSALLNGAALFPFNLKQVGVANLATWLNHENITIFGTVPMVFRSFIDTLMEYDKFPHVRFVWLGSDRVDKTDMYLFQKYFANDAILRVGMGATETCSTFVEIFYDQGSQVKSNIMPAGYAVSGKEVLIINDDGQPVGINQIGEIAVKSCFLSQGYWRNPELNSAKFLTDPEGGEERIFLTGDLGRLDTNGCLYHLGRKDFQLKIRGHRVEVAEIETALMDIATVKEAVVVGRKNKVGENILIAYFVPTKLGIPTVGIIRQALLEKLPDYMVPSRFVMLDSLPLNSNNKIDRQALPDPGNDRPEIESSYVPPQTPIENKLTEIWSEVLEIVPVGIHDKFLELGGNSLLATRIISKVLNTFQVKLPLKSLFAAPTIAEMAVLITVNQIEKMDQNDLNHVLSELENLSDNEVKKLSNLF